MFADRTHWNLTTNRLSEALRRHRASGKRLIDLTASNPTECGFAYDGESILRALANPLALKYEPQTKGLAPARQAVVEYYAERGVDLSIEDVILTTSTSEAYSYIFRALSNPDDEILIPEPSYPLFDLLADIQDLKLVRYPLLFDHGWHIDFHSLEHGITPRTRAVMIVHPNNPTGHFVKADEAERLGRLCAARNLAIVADEVFFDFGLDGDQRRARSFVHSGEALTFTLSGLSKIAGLPQMKVAWLVASGPAERKNSALDRLEVIADTYLSMNAPVQHALPELLAGRNGFQAQVIARVRENLRDLDRQLQARKICTRLKFEGGWNAVLRVPVTSADEDFAVRLLVERGVHVHPGHFYGFAGDGYFVVSLIAGQTDFTEGIRALLEMF
jgi:aspartate/methionine/tyrosine aminotransferase